MEKKDKEAGKGKNTKSDQAPKKENSEQGLPRDFDIIRDPKTGQFRRIDKR